jgi:hypothetical protein
LTACGTPAAAPEVDDMEMEVPEEEATVEQAEPEEEVVEEEPVEEEATAEIAPLEPTTPPAAEPLPPDPIELTIRTEDGLDLVGTYFPAAVNPAPIVVLMHWAPGTQEDWFAEGFDWPQLALILQNRQDELASVGVLASPQPCDRGAQRYELRRADLRLPQLRQQPGWGCP